MKFQGYRRENGSAGVNNIMAAVTSAGRINALATLISKGIQGTMPLGHNLSYSHLGDDLKPSKWILVNLVGNPNICGAVFVDIGCE